MFDNVRLSSLGVSKLSKGKIIARDNVRLSSLGVMNMARGEIIAHDNAVVVTNIVQCINVVQVDISSSFQNSINQDRSSYEDFDRGLDIPNNISNKQ